MNSVEIYDYLEQVCINSQDEFRLQELMRIVLDNKKREVQRGNELNATEYWCLEQILKIQNHYIDAYKQMKAGKYYKGWCSLERCEIEIFFLSKHKEIGARFHLSFIENQVMKYQKLFPYKYFFSTEFLQKEIRCSICDKVITPRNKCKHKLGQIYKGELCNRKISGLEILGIALVTNPAHKYAVAFARSDSGDENDNYDYSVVGYLIERLISPFDKWDYVTETKRHPHSRYNQLGRNDPCPCGSGKKYKKCCLLQEGVLRPHIEFYFSNPPPKELLHVEYTKSR